MILRLSVSSQYQQVTDRQTDTRTETRPIAKSRSNIADAPHSSVVNKLHRWVLSPWDGRSLLIKT